MRIAAALLLLPVAAFAAAATPHVQVTVNEGARRVDITVDGKPFTSYIWPTTLKKPVLYPLRTRERHRSSRAASRSNPRKGERVDHPHHVGLWLNYGDVNGLDFWNNSDAIPAEQAPKMGTILHRRIVDGEERRGSGRARRSRSDWVRPDDKPLLQERTRFIFRGGGDSRTIDRVTTLTALDQTVDLQRQQGRLSRHARRARARAAGGQTGSVHRRVRQGDGGPGARQHRRDRQVHQQRRQARATPSGARAARWTMLRGTVDAEPVTIAILDTRRTPASRPTGTRAATACSPPIRSARRMFTNGKKELEPRRSSPASR